MSLWSFFCVGSWGSSSLCSVKLSLTDVSMLSDLLELRLKKKTFYTVFPNTHRSYVVSPDQANGLKTSEIGESTEDLEINMSLFNTPLMLLYVNAMCNIMQLMLYRIFL